MRLLFLLLISFATQGQILYHENADGPTLFNTVVKQTSTKYGITQTKCFYYNGTRSAKFELRDTDPEIQSGTRAEITFPTTTNLNRWYSFAVFFPGLDWEYDSADEVIMQWHQGGGATPALCIRTKKDSIYLRVMGNKWLNLGAIDKNKWHSYVMHVQHSADSKGLVEMWRNGKILLKYAGQNMYPVTGDFKMPNWKLGIYKSTWNGSSTTMTDRRVLLYDEIKMGSEKATYTEMLPRR